ncbi:large-conductance mechanosensitive channel protein MscL [Haloferula sp.]|uniref:large-conductance mechanosensitive channel protein MscL n=1 Tax=Haloferula sp. TaxID=2497595 RepID=UPI0032A0B54A
MIKEFKEFAFKGNLVDMAVGFILGGGFATVVKSLVDNVIMPPLGAMLANVDFAKMKHVFQPGVAEVKDADGKVTTAAVPEVAIFYGQFIQDFISFALLAFVVFIIVKKVLVAMKKEEEKPAEKPPEPSAEEKLLTEIRDVLKAKG